MHKLLNNQCKYLINSIKLSVNISYKNIIIFLEKHINYKFDQRKITNMN